MTYRKKKQIVLETANNLFRNTKINTTTEKSHLGAVIGSMERNLSPKKSTNG